MHDIQVLGPQSVVISLNHKGLFNRVLDEISSENTEWIQLAPQLAKATDAGDSEGLTVALAGALPKNPKAVLAESESHINYFGSFLFHRI